MNFRFLVPVFLALSLALALFTILSARTHYTLNDGPDLHVYGFPVPWHAPSPVISMARDVDLKAATFDFGFYLLPLALLIFTGRKFLAPRWRSVLVASVMATVVGTLGLLMAIGPDPAFHGTGPRPEAVVKRKTTVQFGWDFR